MRLALEKPVRGALHLMLAVADTVMDRPSRDLMKEVYPNVPIRKTIGEHETLLSIDRARSVLGYSPSWSWRNQRQEQKPK